MLKLKLKATFNNKDIKPNQITDKISKTILQKTKQIIKQNIKPKRLSKLKNGEIFDPKNIVI